MGESSYWPELLGPFQWTELLYQCKLALSAVSRTPHGTQYTEHSLKHMLPQHHNTYNDVFLLINLTKRNFSEAQRKLPEDGPEVT